jgi:hypothetical protein
MSALLPKADIAERDQDVRFVCRRFAGSDATTRAITRTSVSMDDFYTLFTFARRSAVVALRDNQSSHIIDGLTAIAVIEPKRVDFRDALVPLALLYNTAIRIGDNPDTLVRTAVAFAESNMSALMEGFINRSPNDKDLRQWGFLVELAGQSTAESLDALSRAKCTRKNSFSMLAIRNARLFCLEPISKLPAAVDPL